jgi:hypothetical protein
MHRLSKNYNVIPVRRGFATNPGSIAERARPVKIMRADEWVPGLPRIKSGVARDDGKGIG